jgi:type VI protein secretion system component Hcp
MPTSLNEGRGKEIAGGRVMQWWLRLKWRRGGGNEKNWIVTQVTGVIISHTSLN